MNNIKFSHVVVFALVFGLFVTAAVLSPIGVTAQDPAADTPTPEPPKPTVTEPPTNTPPPVPTNTRASRGAEMQQQEHCGDACDKDDGGQLRCPWGQKLMVPARARLVR